MSKVTISDPAVHAEKSVDGNGRVYLGKDYANTDIRVTVEVLE